MPLDPFDEERHRLRLIDEAMGGSVRRILDEERAQRKLIEAVMKPSIVQSILDDEKKHRQLLENPATKLAQQIIHEEEARRKYYDYGSTASSRALQDSISAAMDSIMVSSTNISQRLKNLGIIDGFAEPHSSLAKAASGITEQYIALLQEFRPSISNTAQLLDTFGAYSNLATQMRSISEHINLPDNVAAIASLRESQNWDALRAYYDFDEDASISEMLLQISARLDAPEKYRKPLTLGQIWEIIQFLWFVFSVYALIVGMGDYTDADRARDENTALTVERVEAQQQIDVIAAALKEAFTLAEIERLNSLPRAYVIATANVRIEPYRSANRIARLEANVTVAITERDGRWLKVIYRDPLNDSIEAGWIYQSSLEMIGEAEASK